MSDKDDQDAERHLTAEMVWTEIREAARMAPAWARERASELGRRRAKEMEQESGRASITSQQQEVRQK